MTRELPLTRGRIALVDDDLYEALSQYKWHFDDQYAARGESRGGKVRKIYLHTQIMGKQVGQEIDHINHNKLDCRRSNLRFVTRNGNCQNMSLHQGTSSQYRGVCLIKKSGRWLASITANYKARHLGVFDNEVDAALAYDHAARTLFGAGAFCNFPEAEGISQDVRRLIAHQWACHWLAEINQLEEAGKKDTTAHQKAERKAQHWLDRLNVLEGNT